MPPRRTSRAPSVSAGPHPVETQPNKRKRGQSAVPETNDENETKPTRSRRAPSSRVSATPAPSGRRSARSKTTLPEVAESEEEEDEQVESAPPVKKARPSIESREDDVKMEEDDDEEIETRPKRGGRRAPSTSQSTAPTSRVPSGRRGNSRKASSVATSGPSVASAASEPIVEQEYEEEPAPVKPGRGSKKPVKAESDSGSEDAEEDEEDEEPKSRRKGKGKATSTGKGKAPAKKKKGAFDEDSDDDELPDLAPPPSRPLTSPVKPKAKEPSPPAEEEEEHPALFQPPPMPLPSSLPATLPEEPTGPVSRLVIHKLVLVNFKSYAGRQEIGPFHKSFSAIVGPNGSGKSNTIDALLFVFGYRASKMRQGKLSELIHNSANHLDLDECSVEVHFRDIIDLPGPDAFKVVPNSQLVVARAAFKNNSSRYTINGKNKSLTDVQVLLKGRGIDLDHNRFLILQGEVESISQMKPKAPNEHEDGLLEYLEDIIGTTQYKKPIEESMAKVEALQEDRQVKLNRLRLVEKEKEALSAQKKEAEDHLRLMNEQTRLLSRQYQLFMFTAFERERKIDVAIDKMQKELAIEKEKHQGTLDEVEELQKHFKDREAAYTEIQEEATKAEKDLAAREKQEVTLQERRKHANGKLKKLKKSVTDDTNTLKKAENTIKDSQERIKQHKRELDEKEDELVREEEVLDGIQEGLRGKTQGIYNQIQAKQKELQPWTVKINQQQAAIDVATSERDDLTKKAEALESATHESAENLKTLQADYKTKTASLEALKQEKQQLQRDIKVADDRVQHARSVVGDARQKANAARNKVEEAKSTQNENRSRNDVLGSLTRLRDAGNNEGFHGRLGSLGTIHEKYDVAISTACGASLNQLVVDKVSQAQHCFEYLRQNGVGRATIIALEKLSTSGWQKINTPENVPRLFDLVKPKDPKFIPAFWKAIHNTLVAEDMDQASRIAYQGKRWRVVTLAGGLIETSGAMSGGGTSVSKGYMSNKLAADAVSPQVLQRYERENQEAQGELQEAITKLQNAEAELEQLTKRGPEIDLSYQKLTMEVENVKRRIVDAEKRVKELNAQNKPNAGDVARIKVLDKEIISGEKELAKLKQNAEAIEQDIKALEAKILEIGGAKLLTQKSKVDGIRLIINLANEEITKAEVAGEKAKKDITKFKSQIESNSAALEQAETELEGLDEEIEELVQYISNLRVKVEEATAAAENQKEDLDEIKNELDQAESALEKFKTKESKLNREIAELTKEKVESNNIIVQYQSKHEELKLEEIEDDDEEETAPEQSSEAPKETREGEDEDGEEAEGDGDGEPSVKPEPGTKPPKPKSEELKIYTNNELSKMRMDAVMADLAFAEEQLKNSKPDMSVLTEYKRREADFLNRAKELDEITNARNAEREIHDGLRKKRLDEFMAGFNLISLKLKEMYQMITLGGNAELELVDSLDPFSEGIIFSVMPPKKSWKNISNLSGGEKTLSSLALVFALHVFKPTPLYFMDEIDAALDFRNVSIVANYIKDRTKNAQFIIISLRNDMFELSQRLVGIYKTSNATRSIAIDNHSLRGSAIPMTQAPKARVPQTQGTGNEENEPPTASVVS